MRGQGGALSDSRPSIMADVAAVLATSMATGDSEVDARVLALASTGKMLRPRMTVEIALALADDIDHVSLIRAAAAIELLHCASLFHDDVVDEAASRRGVPTLNMTEGTGAAVLVGDLLLARGMLQIRKSGLKSFVWEHALEQLTLGQLYEKKLTAESDVSDVERYMSLKTASLFEAAAELGARCASSDPTRIEDAKTFGHSFGMAFQMLDDLLDVLGDPDRLGKPVEQDMPNGVFGIASLQARRSAPLNFKELLDSEDFAGVYAIVRSEEPIGSAVELMHRYIDTADRAAARIAGRLEESPLTEYALRYVQDAMTRFVMPEYAYLIGRK